MGTIVNFPPATLAAISVYSLSSRASWTSLNCVLCVSRRSLFAPQTTMAHVDLLVTCAAFLLILYLYSKKRINGVYSHLPYPPGPKKLPLIGNLLDMPTSFEWFTYHKWCKEFSEFKTYAISHFLSYDLKIRTFCTLL